MTDAFDALLAAVGPAARADLVEGGAEARESYARALDEVRAELPRVLVAPDVFARWIAERLPADSDGAAARALASLCVGDLYLAAACAAGQPEAIAAFEARYFAEVALAARRAPRANLAVDDVKQLVRERLFVGDATRGPRISEYRGTGAMRSWLRVTVARIVLNLATRGPRETLHEDDVLAEIVIEGESSELSLIKDKYRVEFRAAVQVALAALEPEARSLLAHAFAQGLSIDRIGAIYGIHRATAARRLQRARELFVEETRRALAHRLGGASADEVDSIIGLIRSRFDVTLGGMLREGDPPALGSDGAGDGEPD